MSRMGSEIVLKKRMKNIENTLLRTRNFIQTPLFLLSKKFAHRNTTHFLALLPDSE